MDGETDVSLDTEDHLWVESDSRARLPGVGLAGRSRGESGVALRQTETPVTPTYRGEPLPEALARVLRDAMPVNPISGVFSSHRSILHQKVRLLPSPLNLLSLRNA